MTETFIEVKFKELNQQVNDWIKKLYNKSDTVLSPASPYGHILGAVEKIFSTSMLYLKNVVAQFDITNPANDNMKMIRMMARLAGYNPSRSMSATGTISIKINPGVDISSEIGGSQITILNNTSISNRTNNLNYFIDLGGEESITYTLDPTKEYFFPVVQGTLEKQTYTGSGELNQTISVTVPAYKQIENFRLSVYVNGQYYSIKDCLYDMLENENACIIRTGLDNGVDVMFGNGNYGFVPVIGSQIMVKYVLTDGTNGNLPHHKVNDFDFVDDVYDANGATVEVNEKFTVSIIDEIGMGSNGETAAFTRAAIPNSSRNFVLSKPANYKFHLERLNIYSQIDAFTTQKLINNVLVEDSVIYLFLVPDIRLYMGSGVSYFDLDMNVFYLDDSEKSKVEKYLKMQGIICTGNSMKIIDPKIKKYAVSVFLEVYDDVNEENLRGQILAVLSAYFTEANRNARVPSSDLVRLISALEGVMSVKVDFLSEENEAYHLAFETYKISILKANPTINPTTIKMDGYEPNKIIGLDARLGDIIYDKDVLIVVRGGWSTREGIYLEDKPSTSSPSSVNIIIDKTKNNRNFRY